MFGHHKAKREKKRAQKQQEVENNLTQNAQKENQSSINKESALEEKVKKNKEHTQNAKKEAHANYEEFMNRKVQGLAPEARNAMQYEAQRGIQRSAQAANRKLLGEQSQAGIGGRGGVGIAQQKELNRLANEANYGVVRDLDKLDVDLQNKNRAAMYAYEQGEISQDQLNREIGLEELEYEEEKRRQRQFEEAYYRQFTRV